MNPVVHFEMPAEDRSRMRKFYESTFGWKTEQLGPEMGDYVLVTTTETDASRRPKTPGMINGGFYPKRMTGRPNTRLSSSLSTTSEDPGRKLKRPGARCSASRWRYRAWVFTSLSSIAKAIVSACCN